MNSQFLKGLLLLAKESSSKLLPISLSDQPHYKVALLKLHFQLAEKPTYNYLLWELLISRLDREIRNPQPELLKVQIRTFRIFGLCQNQLCFGTSVFIQTSSSSSSAPPGWVR